MTDSVVERTPEHWVLHSRNPIYDAVLDDEEMDRLGRAWLREKIGPVSLEEMNRDIGAVGWLVRTLADALDGGQE